MILGILIVLGFIVTLLIHALSVPQNMTPSVVVPEIIKAMKLTKEDVLYELGSGTGKVGFAASKAGATVKMFEISPLHVVFSRLNSIFSGISKGAGKIDIEAKSMYKVDLTNADKVYVYLNPKAIMKLRRTLIKGINGGLTVYVYKDEIKGVAPNNKIELSNGYPLFAYTLD